MIVEAILIALVAGAIACSHKTDPTPDLATAAGPMIDLAGVTDAASHPGDDLAMSGGDLLACTPTMGNDCPPTAGNCKGIGKPCTKGGGECAADGNSCDKDQSNDGVGACIKVGGCTPGMHQCGAGASCCATQDTLFFPVCIANQCLPNGCNQE